MKDKLLKFMSGRYGLDQLYRFLLLTSVVCILLSAILREYALLSSLFSYAALALLIWAMYRVMSRKVEKRYLENLHYLERIGSIRQHFRMNKEKFHQRKDYKFFVCPTCKTNLRVPKGKGKVNITCSKCGNRFQGKT
ncbi:MAG: hypothetical protein J6J04_04870 [Oscillospiraceae bacterium]|nr:hypothetical protein [Oscillospiraceae bacterium]